MALFLIKRRFADRRKNNRNSVARVRDGPRDTHPVCSERSVAKSIREIQQGSQGDAQQELFDRYFKRLIAMATVGLHREVVSVHRRDGLLLGGFPESVG
jgi:hypothetical protein